MASSIFYQFHVNNCIVDSELLDHFYSAGWKLIKNEDPFFTKYEWPDIKLSKSIIRFLDDDQDKHHDFRFAIELLGCYQPENDCTEEGTVILFYEKIKEAAEHYIIETGSTTALEKVIDRLTTIVLIHELVHWLMHYVNAGDCSKSPVGIRYKKFDELEFHEGFAEIFTHWFTQNKGGIYKDIFDWLSRNQPPQYRAYTKLLDKRVKTPSHAITLLSICKLFDIQSLDKALKIAEIYPCIDWATFKITLLDPFKFKALLSILDFREKKKLFEFLVDRMPGDLSTYLGKHMKDKKSYLKLINEILIGSKSINAGPDFSGIKTALDLKELGF